MAIECSMKLEHSILGPLGSSVRPQPPPPPRRSGGATECLGCYLESELSSSNIPPQPWHEVCEVRVYGCACVCERIPPRSPRAALRAGDARRRGRLK